MKFVDLSYKQFKTTDIARCLKARYTAAPTNHACEDSGVLIGGDNVIRAVLTPDREEKRQNGRRMKDDGEPMFTLTAQDRHGVAVGGYNDVRIRRLTPRECFRLQGFPDEYFDRAKAAGVSDSQLYKQAGNSVTVNVARAIGERLKEIENE